MTVKRRHPVLTRVGDAVTMIDTLMTGQLEFNAVYLLDGDEPCLVETGPGADVELVLEALEILGIGGRDLAHIVVTHVHLDHAGACGALAQRFARAIVWVHERGAPHLVDPSRLVASTARTYGADRMLTFFGHTLPVDADRVRSVVDGDTLRLGSRELSVIHTPGHASHHVTLHDSRSDAIFTGEAIGSYLPWGPASRPALPPPEVDVEAAIASIERIRSRQASVLLTSHFGPAADADDACDTAMAQIGSWSGVVRRRLERDPEASTNAVAVDLAGLAEAEFEGATGRPIDIARYDAIGSIAMNAAGLARYWRKRWEQAAAEGSNSA